MKILLFTDTLCDTNGVSRFLQDLGTHCPAFHLVTATRKSCNLPFKNWTNLPVRLRLAMPFYPQLDLSFPSYAHAKTLFETFDPDLVHVSTPGPVGLLGRALARKYHKPLAGVYHTDFPSYVHNNLPLWGLKRLTQMSMRWFYKPFSLLFARSQSEIPKLQPLLHKTLTLFKAGVDTQVFTPLALPKEARLTLLYVGRISPEKNIGFLWEVWEILQNLLGPQAVQLWCVGECTHPLLRTQGEALGVHFLGKQPKEALPALYAKAHLFVFPSLTETLGQVVLESLSCGTPVVVSDQGGPRTILASTTRPCGLILSTRFSSTWAHAIKSLLLNEPRLSAMAEAARAENYDIKTSVEDFLAVHVRMRKEEAEPEGSTKEEG
ncbi:glycosyltransferase [Sulfurospirillum sp. T05]|uniref:Glycosyltransferase n=1 Tax=Sulfurospirillum tamanense TaxID=2813362 RepID=A0ABS2WTF8_9BACT|nr:glycosyltransferase [Sulfurospirillum tamanensis]MBN2964951.1 glycosyltransferase [Sulfurospirillum tamanensis]